MNYNEALEILGNRDSKKIGNNTYLKRGDNCIKLVLHNTAIITFLKDRFTLDNGGWLTQTTKRHINQFIPSGYGLTTHKKMWIVLHENIFIVFDNGLTLSYEGLKK